MIKIDWEAVFRDGVFGFILYKSKDFTSEAPGYYVSQHCFENAPLAWYFCWGRNRSGDDDAVIIYRLNGKWI
jgi:hypothetical protein